MSSQVVCSPGGRVGGSILGQDATVKKKTKQRNGTMKEVNSKVAEARTGCIHAMSRRDRGRPQKGDAGEEEGEQGPVAPPAGAPSCSRSPNLHKHNQVPSSRVQPRCTRNPEPGTNSRRVPVPPPPPPAPQQRNKNSPQENQFLHLFLSDERT